MIRVNDDFQLAKKSQLDVKARPVSELDWGVVRYLTGIRGERWWPNKLV
jgi:hypothetical protein